MRSKAITRLIHTDGNPQNLHLQPRRQANLSDKPRERRRVLLERATESQMRLFATLQCSVWHSVLWRTNATHVEVNTVLRRSEQSCRADIEVRLHNLVRAVPDCATGGNEEAVLSNESVSRSCETNPKLASVIIVPTKVSVIVRSRQIECPPCKG